MSKKTTHPERLLGSLLNAVYWVDESLQARLEAAGWERINHAKSMVMVNVFNGITRPIELAKNLGVSRQAMHQTIQEMVKIGLLQVENDPNDRRAKVVSFHPDSLDIMTDALEALHAIEHDLADRIGKRRLQQMRSTLEMDWGPISDGLDEDNELSA